MSTSLFKALNVRLQCAELHMSVWSCPRFIFLVMGVVTCVSIGVTYLVGVRYNSDPEAIIFLVVALTIFLLTITHLLTSAFERVVTIRNSEAARSAELLELRDQFIFLAVHDLRSAATAVKWGLRALEPKQSHLDQSEQQIFRNIRDRNERTLALIHNLLLITRIENQSITPKYTEVIPKTLLTEQVNLADPLTKNKNLTIALGFPESIPTITTDPDILGDILAILLRNAVTHATSDTGHVALDVTVTETALRIRTTNDGDGIPESAQEQVFRKFWKKAGSGEIERSGFGLYIARSLAELLDGTLAFTSQPGSTVFTLELPLRPNATQQPPSLHADT